MANTTADEPLLGRAGSPALFLRKIPGPSSKSAPALVLCAKVRLPSQTRVLNLIAVAEPFASTPLGVWAVEPVYKTAPGVAVNAWRVVYDRHSGSFVGLSMNPKFVPTGRSDAAVSTALAAAMLLRAHGLIPERPTFSVSMQDVERLAEMVLAEVYRPLAGSKNQKWPVRFANANAAATHLFKQEMERLAETMSQRQQSGAAAKDGYQSAPRVAPHAHGAVPPMPQRADEYSVDNDNLDADGQGRDSAGAELTPFTAAEEDADGGGVPQWLLMKLLYVINPRDDVDYDPTTEDEAEGGTFDEDAQDTRRLVSDDLSNSGAAAGAAALSQQAAAELGRELGIGSESDGSGGDTTSMALDAEEDDQGTEPSALDIFIEQCKQVCNLHYAPRPYTLQQVLRDVQKNAAAVSRRAQIANTAQAAKLPDCPAEDQWLYVAQVILQFALAQSGTWQFEENWDPTSFLAHDKYRTRVQYEQNTAAMQNAARALLNDCQSRITELERDLPELIVCNADAQSLLGLLTVAASVPGLL